MENVPNVRLDGRFSKTATFDNNGRKLILQSNKYVVRWPVHLVRNVFGNPTVDEVGIAGMLIGSIC